jgi:hypothetical protein
METLVAAFKIRNVGLATRCEVCHQDDLFDPMTGDCGRCRGALAALETSPPATLPETAAEAGSPPHSFGWRLASAALILSIILAIPGTMALVVILYLSLTILGGNVAFSDLLLYLVIMGGVLGFIGAGYYQLYWYWKIWRFETESDRRRALWFWSTVYNLLLLLGMIFLLSLPGIAGNPLSLLWFALLGAMTMISGLAYREECRPH